MEELYTVKEIADLVGVSKTTIQKTIKANNLTCQKIEHNRQYYDLNSRNIIIKSIRPDFSPTETANQSENSPTNIENQTKNRPQNTERQAQKSENSTTKSENSQTKTANSTTVADNMGRMLDFIEKQAQEKDKLIADLQKELAEARAELAQKDAFIRSQSEQFTFLLEQSQKLQAGAQMLLLADNNTKTITESTDEQKTKKQGFFKKLFKK